MFRNFNDQEAQKVISDPEFDVEAFLGALNLHFSNGSVLNLMMNDPALFLYMASSEYSEVLEDQVEALGFDGSIFPKIQELGYEVWTKKTTRGNIWYGLIISDEVAVYYRNVHAPELTISREENAAEESRKYYASLNMYKMGDESTKKRAQANIPGYRPIDLVRKAIADKFVKEGFRDKRYGSKAKHGISTRLSFEKWLPKREWFTINMEVTGRKNAKVKKLKAAKMNNLYSYWKTWEVDTATEISLTDSQGEYVDPGVIANEVFEWYKEQDANFKTIVEAK